MKYSFLLYAALSCLNTFAQEDTVKTRRLDEITITGQREAITIDRLPDLQETYLRAGKKNEVINVQALDANIAEKTPRQIFAKVPGVFVYDMDGSGNQVNISTRGLDPHRGWEFNIRRNGAITNSDMYGYPASHYSMPFDFDMLVWAYSSRDAELMHGLKEERGEISTMMKVLKKHNLLGTMDTFTRQMRRSTTK